MMAHFLRNIEIWLSLAGLAVIMFAPLLFGADADPWRVTALTAVAVGLLHGVIFWLIRRHQRRVREQAIVEIRGMLKHLINNPLCTISLQTGMMDTSHADAREILVSVDRISSALRNISEESLTKWREEEALLEP